MRRLVFGVVLVVLLIMLYSYGWNSGLFNSFLTSSQKSYGKFSGPYMIKTTYGGQLVLHTGDTISVSISRAYLFGLVRLPVIVSGKDISWLHKSFFWSMYAVIIILIILEFFRLKNKKHRPKKFKITGIEPEIIEENMEVKNVEEKETEKMWKKWGIYIGKAIIVWLVIQIITGSWPASVSTAFLYLYISYKFKKSLG